MGSQVKSATFFKKDLRSQKRQKPGHILLYI